MPSEEIVNAAKGEQAPRTAAGRVKGTPKPMTDAKRVFTINLHRKLKEYHGKQRAGRAIREIVAFAKANMRTEKVIVTPRLNTTLWRRGIRNVPNKMRLVITRRKDADDQFVSEVDVVNVESFDNLLCENKDKEL